MNRDRKIPPDQAWDAVERMALDDEAKRIESLSAGALDAELDRQGFWRPGAAGARCGAGGSPGKGEEDASEAQDASGPVPKLRTMARPWAHARAIAWTAGAALAAAALAAVAMNRTDGVVVNRDIGPDTLDGDIAKKPEPSPKEVATKLRYEAYDLVRLGRSGRRARKKSSTRRRASTPPARAAWASRLRDRRYRKA